MNDEKAENEIEREKIANGLPFHSAFILCVYL
jgi:hypothetical protein